MPNESPARDRRVIVVRELATSDLGWFAAKRPFIKSKQRAININARVMELLVGPTEEGFLVTATCTHPRARHTEERALGRVHKNWRLGGRQVVGDVFAQVAEGDLFVASVTLKHGRPTAILWTVVMGEAEPAAFARTARVVRQITADRMAVLEEGSEGFAALSAVLTL